LPKPLEEKTFGYKTDHYVEKYSGAALWLPPNVDPDIDTLLRVLQQTTSKKAQKVVREAFEKMASYHPKEPNWY
jgi:hypothetical protein